MRGGFGIRNKRRSGGGAVPGSPANYTAGVNFMCSPTRFGRRAPPAGGAADTTDFLNLAQSQIMASSEAVSWTDVSFINDTLSGNSNRWCSAGNGAEEKLWLRCAGVTPISRIGVWSEGYPGSMPSLCILEYWDGSIWTEAYRFNPSQSLTTMQYFDTGNSVAAEFWRISMPGNQAYKNIEELELYP